MPKIDARSLDQYKFSFCSTSLYTSLSFISHPITSILYFSRLLGAHYVECPAKMFSYPGRTFINAEQCAPRPT